MSNFNHAQLSSLVVRRIFNRTFGDFEIMLVKLFGYKLQIFGNKLENNAFTPDSQSKRRETRSFLRVSLRLGGKIFGLVLLLVHYQIF